MKAEDIKAGAVVRHSNEDINKLTIVSTGLVFSELEDLDGKISQIDNKVLAEALLKDNEELIKQAIK